MWPVDPMTELTDIDLLDEPELVAARRGVGLVGVLLIMVIIAATLVFGLALVRQRQPAPTSGPAPDFTVTTYDGETIRLADLRGQVVVLNFWASWCVPCRIEAPELETVWREYRERGVVFLGVAYVDAEPKSLAFIDEFRLTYPNAPDTGTRVSDAYHIRGVPETFVIDRDGNIVQFYYARVSADTLRQALNRLL